MINNLTQIDFAKSINYKNSNNNIYPYDSFRPGNLKEKISFSPEKFQTHKDFYHLQKRNNTSYNERNNKILGNNSKSLMKLNDIERKNEEINKYKILMNEKVKEIHNMKIAYLKLDQENKKNIKIIEEIIIETAKNKNNGGVFEFNPDNFDTKMKNFLEVGNTSDKLLSKLIESHAINNLKRQIFDYKILLGKKDEEISKLKINSRYSKYHDIEYKLNSTVKEMLCIKEDYDDLMNLFNEKDNALKFVIEEREYFKKVSADLKFKYGELKPKMQDLERININLAQKITKLEDINSNNRYQNISYKNQIKEKDLEINHLKEDLKSVEKFKNEKENFEKNFISITKNYNYLKEDIDKKNQQVKTLQKLTRELKNKKNDSNIQEENLFNFNNIPIHIKIVIKEKDKKILILEKEINKLQNEIDKLNRDLHNNKFIKNQVKIKINSVCLEDKQNENQIQHNASKPEKLFISHPDVATNCGEKKTKLTLLNKKLKDNNEKKESNHFDISTEKTLEIKPNDNLYSNKDEDFISNNNNEINQFKFEEKNYELENDEFKKDFVSTNFLVDMEEKSINKLNISNDEISQNKKENINLKEEIFNGNEKLNDACVDDSDLNKIMKEKKISKKKKKSMREKDNLINEEILQNSEGEYNMDNLIDSDVEKMNNFKFKKKSKKNKIKNEEEDNDQESEIYRNKKSKTKIKNKLEDIDINENYQTDENRDNYFNGNQFNDDNLGEQQIRRPKKRKTKTKNKSDLKNFKEEKFDLEKLENFNGANLQNEKNNDLNFNRLLNFSQKKEKKMNYSLDESNHGDLNTDLENLHIGNDLKNFKFESKEKNTRKFSENENTSMVYDKENDFESIPDQLDNQKKNDILDHDIEKNSLISEKNRNEINIENKISDHDNDKYDQEFNDFENDS